MIRNLEAGLEYPPEESEGASWDIMSCHVEFQAVRAVETRSPGGRDFPQRRLVSDFSREEELRLELLLLLSSDIFMQGRVA